MQTNSPIMPIGQSAVRSIPLPEGQRIEVEFDAGEATIEIRHVEPNECVSGSVFMRSADIPSLIAALASATHATGGQ